MVLRPAGSWTFELPGGLVDEQGHRRRRAELRPLSGNEEDWIASSSGLASASVVTSLLSACLVALDGAPVDNELVRRMSVGDRDFLMLQLRRISVGDSISAVSECPACRERIDVDFSLGDVVVQPRAQPTDAYTLERNGRPIRFRLPVGGDQEAVLGAESCESAAAILLDRCVTDDGGIPLSDEDRAAVVDAMDETAPQVDLDLNLVCPACAHEFSNPFDLTAYFLHEIRRNSRQLLRETHLLAFYYHWSEAEILHLSRERRRSYLALLSGTLRPV